MKDKLALAIGHLFGDGGIQNNGRVHYCNTEEFLIEEFLNSMSIFKIKPWKKEEPNITRIRYPVEIGKKLWLLFGKFSYGKDTKTITKEIDEMPLSWKAKMLSAYFNDDGSVVNFPPNYKVIAIKQKLKNLIEFIGETLKELGINSSIQKDENRWHLRIHGYKNLKKFQEKVNFSENYRKRKKLEELIASISRPKQITKEQILKCIKKGIKTRKEISEKLGMDPQIIYGHLHGWKRKNRNSNKGLIDLGLVKIKKKGRINIYELSSTSPAPMWGWDATGASTSAQC